MTENRKYLEGIREEIENYYNGFEEDGEEIKNYDFMFWIDKKHTEYRNIHNMPEHIMLNDEQVKDFCAFIDL